MSAACPTPSCTATYAEAFAVQRFQSGLSAFTVLWNYLAAPDGGQHRDRRGGRLFPGAGGLGGGDRAGRRGPGHPVRGHLLLDAAALLGPGYEVPRGLRRRGAANEPGHPAAAAAAAAAGAAAGQLATADGGHGSTAGVADQAAAARDAHLARLNEAVRDHGRWHGLR